MEGIPGMSNRKLYCVVILSILMLSVSTQAEWNDRFTPAKITYLSDILNSPQCWLDVPVRIPLRFSRIGNIYNPFFTQFNSEQYINFAAWDIQAPIWNQDGFNNDYPHFYFEKDNPEAKTFMKLNTFDTVCVLAKATSIFRQKPYFRVVWVCSMGGNLNVDNLRVLYQGMKSLKQRNFDQAMKSFQVVLTTNPPVDIGLMLHKTIAKIYIYEKKQFAEALQELTNAQQKYENTQDQELKELMDRCAFYMEHGGTPPAMVYVEEEVEKKPAKTEPAKEGKTTASPVVEMPQPPTTPAPVKEEP